MTVKQFASVAHGDDVEYSIISNGNAYPFDPGNDFFLCAYGDFEIARIELSAIKEDKDKTIWAKIKLKSQLVKEVKA